MTKKEAIKNEHARNYWHYTRQAAREIIKNHNMVVGGHAERMA